VHARPPDIRRLIILGSTGSIGRQTLEVVAHLNGLHARGKWPTRLQVVGLAVRRDIAQLMEQAAAFGVADTAIADSELRAGARRHGPDAAERLVREVDCDLVVAAMVGAAGLPATLAAIEAGRDVALANKETLVAAGALVIPAARRSGSRLLPVDSEHAALWQCLAGRTTDGRDANEACPPFTVGNEVRRVILTASGGPFRDWPAERIRRATRADALNHPTWKMGEKITVDCASLTNKTLEIIDGGLRTATGLAIVVRAGVPGT
jgi:1-deoxy-D-xylulose-5-phosphate reductoisomerase